MPLLSWESGIFSVSGSSVDPVITVVGSSRDVRQALYSIVRVSWRDHSSEMGYVLPALGARNFSDLCMWAVSDRAHFFEWVLGRDGVRACAEELCGRGEPRGQLS